MPVRKSDYCPVSMSYPGTLGGAVPISTSGNRNTSGWPLYITSNNKLHRHSRKMAYEVRDEATSLYISYMVFMIITQTRCTMELFLSFSLSLFLAVISEERRHRPSTSSSRPRERNLSPAQNAKSDPLEHIHAGVMRQSINNLGVLIWLWEIRSGPISVRLRCIHAS